MAASVSVSMCLCSKKKTSVFVPFPVKNMFEFVESHPDPLLIPDNNVSRIDHGVVFFKYTSLVGVIAIGLDLLFLSVLV
jgi:hypothetical protein